jgi:hypothetical protein
LLVVYYFFLKLHIVLGALISLVNVGLDQHRKVYSHLYV